ncbi:MAG: DoxX family protein, partial [Burkholderiales bacterium]|nr:DoxX family protein [Burkholderiales bacterium]
MTAVHDAAALLGRILLAYLYIPNGFSKIGGFAGTSGYIASKGLPLPDVGAAIAIAVEVVAGIALLIGWKTRWAALALAV